MKKQALMGLVTAVAVGLAFSLAQAADEARNQLQIHQLRLRLLLKRKKPLASR